MSTIETMLSDYRECRERMDNHTCEMVCEECDISIPANEFICFHRLEVMIEGAVLA